MLGAVRRDVIELIRARHGGRLFVGVIPDVFLTASILHVTHSFETAQMNFGIQGVSTSSNGLAGLDGQEWLDHQDRGLRVDNPGTEVLGDPHLVTNVHAQFLDVLFSAAGRTSPLSQDDLEFILRWNCVTHVDDVLRGESSSSRRAADNDSHGSISLAIPGEVVRRMVWKARQGWGEKSLLLAQLLRSGASYWRSLEGPLPTIREAAKYIRMAASLPASRNVIRTETIDGVRFASISPTAVLECRLRRRPGAR